MGNKRIALNVFFTVVQSVFATACGLLSGRWVVGALGDEGFGVFSVVGCLMSFVLFLNNVLVSSACRHLSSAIGETYHMSSGDGLIYLGRWFSASFYVHLFLPLILCGIGYFIGEWYVECKLVVPETIRGECYWVMRFSLISAFLTILSAPFAAMYTARQYIFVRTAFSIVSTILSAIGVYVLFYFESNRIFYHALIIAGIQALYAIAIVCFAVFTFPECRGIFKGTQWRYVRNLLSFGGATMLEMLGNMVRNQGVAIVVNHFAGVRLNAGMGIANVVSGKTIILGSAIMSSTFPEITTSLAAGNRARAFRLAEKMNLFVPMLYLVLMMPLLANIDFVLKFWLATPPYMASGFCFVCLIFLYINTFADGYQQLINANGKIFAYEVSMGLLLSSSVVLAAGAFSVGLSGLNSVAIGMIIPTCGSTVVRLYFMKRIFGVGPSRWFKQCFMPNVIILVLVFFAQLVVNRIMQEGVLRCFASGVLTALIIPISAYYIVTKDDFEFIRQKYWPRIKRLLSKK